MQKKWLDYLLIYSQPNQEPSYITWVLDNPVIDNMWVIIDNKCNMTILVARWFINDARLQYWDKYSCIGALNKEQFATIILEEVINNSNIWVAWEVPYKVFDTLNKSFPLILDIEWDLKEIIAEKSEDEISNLWKIRAYAVWLLDNLTIVSWMNQKRIEMTIKSTAEKDGYSVTFISIVSGDDLKSTTAMWVSDKVTETSDIICIDYWLEKDGYNSDITRCFFINNDDLEKLYITKVKEYMNKLAVYVRPWVKKDDFIHYSYELAKEYKFDNIDLIDIWHWIWNSYHEFPDLHNDSYTFKEKMVITLEPEVRIWEYLLRHEDMYVIKDDHAYII